MTSGAKSVSRSSEAKRVGASSSDARPPSNSSSSTSSFRLSARIGTSNSPQDRAMRSILNSNAQSLGRSSITLAQFQSPSPTPVPGPGPIPAPPTGTTIPPVGPTPVPNPVVPPSATTPPTTLPPSPPASPPTGTTLPPPVPNPGPVPPISGEIGAAGLGFALPNFANVVSGRHGTAAEAALGILNEVAEGRPPFRPDLGERGGVQWFVTSGSPNVGSAVADTVNIPVKIEIPRGANVVEFNEARLTDIYNSHLGEARRVATEDYQARHPNRSITSTRAQNRINYVTEQIAKSKMWTDVGEQVAASPSGIGRVVQTADGPFNRGGGSGTFMLTSKPNVVSVKGGAAALLDIIQARGLQAEPAVREAAEQAARNGQIAGKLQGVFRVGGRILVVAGAAADGYRIYQADDKVREAVKVGGGWAGAGAAVVAYNSVTGATNAAGPVAWGLNALGNVGAAVGGYFAGEKIAELVYDLAIDPNPIEIPNE